MECCELGGTVPAHIWTDPSEIEPQALEQLGNISKLPWVVHLAVMPDVHFGKGATVGSVIGMDGALAPAAVGVDIGCGMGAVKTNLNARDLPESLAALRLAVEAAIPVSFSSHDSPVYAAASVATSRAARELLSAFKDLDSRVGDLEANAGKQLGTLGGGNHFIELCLDEEGSVWLMLHSGSRNIGKVLAEKHIATARTLAHNKTLPDPELAVFLAGTAEMAAYRRDLFWAQRYAMVNRTIMLELYQRVVCQFFPRVTFGEPVLCHHNYVAEEWHFGRELIVTRKGAIHAGHGKLGIIPGSMGAQSFIVEGLGNPLALESASHGAGRKMSRGDAKRRFTVEDIARQTAGVECRKDAGVIDEAPDSYKDIRAVMAHQADLVRILHTLKQVMCVKGGDDKKDHRKRR